jgi:hypothetical protein
VIEELVLHGFPRGERYRIGEALEQELTRLFAEKGVPDSLGRGGEVDLLRAGSFHVSVVSKPEGVGSQVAQAVYGGLSRWQEDQKPR